MELKDIDTPMKELDATCERLKWRYFRDSDLDVNDLKVLFFNTADGIANNTGCDHSDAVRSVIRFVNGKVENDDI